MTHRKTDILVIGGGLAGSTAAIRLACAGRSVTLVERSTESHNKVCGEFLSAEAIHYLQQCGTSLSDLGAVPLRTIRFATGSSIVEKPLPFAACSLTRRTLDEHLLKKAVHSAVDVQRGATVTSLLPLDGAWCAQLQDGSSLHASNAFLATGKHDLRGLPRPAGFHAGLLGLKMYYRLQPQQHAALRSAVELSLFPGGYAGLQPVEEGAANLCLLIEADRYRTMGSNFNRLTQHMVKHSPHLAERLAAATPLLQKPLAAFQIPYGHVQRNAEPGLWRLGDQAAVIPSFCGDGMAIALHSSAVAVQHFLAGRSSVAFQSELAHQLSRRLTFATCLSRTMVGFPIAAQMVRIFPGMLQYVASLTRIPEGVLLG